MKYQGSDDFINHCLDSVSSSLKLYRFNSGMFEEEILRKDIVSLKQVLDDLLEDLE